LDDFVDRLARRIASFPPRAVALAKESVLLADTQRNGLQEEAYLFQELLRTPEATARMKAFLEEGGQTREGELRVNQLLEGLPSGD